MRHCVDILWLWDQKIFFWVNRFAGSGLDPIFGWTTVFGNISVLLAAIFLGLLIWDARGIFKKFPPILLSVISAAAVGQWIKHATHRPRPLLYFSDAIVNGQVVVHTLFKPIRNYFSFPSGHAVVVFAAVTALVYLYGRKARPLYFLAALVGISRVYVGAHFPSDVIGGALIGSGISWGALEIWRRFFKAPPRMD